MTVTSAADLTALVSQRFDATEAMGIVDFMSRRWRTRGGGNPGFDESINHLASHLERNGFSDAGQLDVPTFEIIDGPLTMHPFAWEPTAGEIAWVGEVDTVIDSYPENPTLVARFSGSTPQEGVVGQIVDVGGGDRAHHYDRVDVRGKIVFGRANAADMYDEAVSKRGAIGVISDCLWRESFYEDHPDMVVTATVSRPSIEEMQARETWALKVSPRTGDQIRGAIGKGLKQLRVKVTTRVSESSQRALVATIPGSEPDAGMIALVSHVDNNRPGANNNATGVAAHLELAKVIAQSIADGSIERPRRSLAFLFGAEHAGTSLWLDTHADGARIVAGFNADMAGADVAKTRGVYRLGRTPDPSCSSPRSVEDRMPVDTASNFAVPGWHFEQQEVALPGHYLNALMADLVRCQSDRVGWDVTENIFEGGSDHDELTSHGVATVLSWYYDDVFLSTNLDTPDKVDPDSMRNVASVHGAAALSIATATEQCASSVVEAVGRAGALRIEDEIAMARARLDKAAEIATNSGRNRWGSHYGEEQQLAGDWHRWYREAICSVATIPTSDPSSGLSSQIDAALEKFNRQASDHLRELSRIAPTSTA